MAQNVQNGPSERLWDAAGISPHPANFNPSETKETSMLNWMDPVGPPPEPEYVPRECHAPKCQRCGKFAKNLTMVYLGWPPEPDHEIGDCCKEETK